MFCLVFGVTSNSFFYHILDILVIVLGDSGYYLHLLFNLSSAHRSWLTFVGYGSTNNLIFRAFVVLFGHFELSVSTGSCTDPYWCHLRKQGLLMALGGINGSIAHQRSLQGLGNCYRRIGPLPVLPNWPLSLSREGESPA